MRIFSLVIGTLIAVIGGLFFAAGILDGIECSGRSSALLASGFYYDCAPLGPLDFIGVIFLLVGGWMVYENIRRDGDIHPKRRRLMQIVVFTLIGAPTCFILFFIMLHNYDGGPSVYSNVPDSEESAPFGIYDITPTNGIPSDVQILEYEIDGNTATAKGVLQNNASVPITYVRLKLACGNGQDTSFVVGSRKKTIRSLNRMTGHYEDREYEVPAAIASGEKYHFEYEINDATVTPSCSLSVDGWTDYRTINE